MRSKINVEPNNLSVVNGLYMESGEVVITFKVPYEIYRKEGGEFNWNLQEFFDGGAETVEEAHQQMKDALSGGEYIEFGEDS